MNSLTNEIIRHQGEIIDIIRRIDENLIPLKDNKDNILFNLKGIHGQMGDIIRLNDKNLVDYESNKC